MLALRRHTPYYYRTATILGLSSVLRVPFAHMPQEAKKAVPHIISAIDNVSLPV